MKTNLFQTPTLYALDDGRGGVRFAHASTAPDILRGSVIDCHKVARTALKALEDGLECLPLMDGETLADRVLPHIEGQGGATLTVEDDGLATLNYAFVIVIGSGDRLNDLVLAWMEQARYFAAQYEAERETALGTVEITPCQ